MRNLTALLSGAAALLLAAAVSTDAEAQSVFQKIFGLGGPQSATPADLPRARQVIPAHRFQSRAAAQRANQSRSANIDGEDDEAGPPDSGGPYKTMCVRSCDGFYFPVRHNARRKNFASDARSCRNACGSDARLFYYSLRGPEGPEAMVDLSGKKYTELPHAFQYRKALVQGCTCKPVPWSYEEARRHQSYADQEAIELAKDEAFLKAQQAAKVEADAKSKGVAVADAADAVSGVEPASTSVDPTSAAASEPPQPGETAPATSTSIDVAGAVYASIAADDAAKSADGTESVAAPMPEAPRAIRRRAKAYVQRTSFKPAASGSWFGGKSKYTWPGDAR